MTIVKTVNIGSKEGGGARARDFEQHEFNPPDIELSEPQRTRKYKLSGDWRDVQQKTLEQWRLMLATDIRTRARHKVLNWAGVETLDQISNVALAQYLVQLNEDRKAKSVDAAGAADELQVKRFAAKRARIEKRMQEYLAIYQVSTPNDRESLRQLCALEEAIADEEMRLHDLETEIKLGGPRVKTKPADEKTKAAINASIKQYRAQYLEFQKILGIDRSSREKGEEELGGPNHIKQMVRDGAALLREMSVPIVCQSCKAEGTLLTMGFVYNVFGNWTLTTVCPRCDKPLVVRQKESPHPQQKSPLDGGMN